MYNAKSYWHKYTYMHNLMVLVLYYSYIVFYLPMTYSLHLPMTYQ